MGVSSGEELLLMSSALQGNGSTTKWRKIRQRILQRDGYVCQMCGVEEANSVDHIVPRLMGGGDEDWNLQTLCQSCNSSKGGRFFSTPKTLPTLHVPFYTKNDSKSHEND